MLCTDQMKGCILSEGLSERATTAAVSFLKLIRLWKGEGKEKGRKMEEGRRDEGKNERRE